jgi:FolB domain-containing protein
MDHIHIRDLSIDCIIGTKPDERVNKQTVVINVTLGCDLARAGKSDCLEDTINYRTLKKQIVAMVETSEFFLVEKMAEEVVQICLATDGVMQARVSVDKPGALTKARSVAVEIEREN